MNIRVYGIKNCDTMKKAFAFLDERGIAYDFHDYKKAGVPADRVKQWSRALGWQNLLNTRGPTWRKLSAEQQALRTEAQAIALMQEFPSVIRRPVIELPDGELLLGFDPVKFEVALAR